MNENDLTSFEMVLKSDSELYSVVSNLDLVLQCWKPNHEDHQESCQSLGELAKYAKTKLLFLLKPLPFSTATLKLTTFKRFFECF